MRKNLAITGTGAVTPAGWGVDAMMAALAAGGTIPHSLLERPLEASAVVTPVLRVPAEGSTTPKFARLRRSSPISKFAAAAAMEALGASRLAEIAAGRLRVGVVFTLTNGCVNYSKRFFGEVLADPALASPILFPETVFNAPASHLSAMIGSTSPNDSLIGDGSGFLTGIDSNAATSMAASSWPPRRSTGSARKRSDITRAIFSRPKARARSIWIPPAVRFCSTTCPTRFPTTPTPVNPPPAESARPSMSRMTATPCSSTASPASAVSIFLNPPPGVIGAARAGRQNSCSARAWERPPPFKSWPPCKPSTPVDSTGRWSHRQERISRRRGWCWNVIDSLPGKRLVFVPPGPKPPCHLTASAASS